MRTATLSWTDWYFEPTVTLGLLLLAAGYVVCRRRGYISLDDDVSPWLSSTRWRPWLFGLGLITAFLALESPIDTGGDRYLFCLHMIQHLLLMMVAPPLVLLGICGTRPIFEGRWSALRAVGRMVTRAWPACVIFNVVMLVWHWAPLYNTTLTVEPLHVLEHITFITAGVIFWWPIVDPFRHPGTVAVGPFTKMAMLVVAGVPPTILGFIFAMAPPLYSYYVDQPRLWGLSPVVDQQIGGVLMLGIGNIIYFIAVMLILWGVLRGSGDDHDHDEDGDVAAAEGRPLVVPRAAPVAAVPAAAETAGTH